MALVPNSFVDTARSKSDPSKSYTFGVASTGELVCNCRGWATYKRVHPRECTHTKSLIAKYSLRVVKSASGEHWVAPFSTSSTPTPTVAPTTPKVPTAPKAKTVVLTPVDTVPMYGRFRTFSLEEPVVMAVYVEPMLAVHPDIDLSAFSASDWVMEEKYDGHRVVVVVNDGDVKAWSRPRAGEDAKVRTLPEHILSEFSAFPTGTYDGELLVPGGTSSDVVKLENQSTLVYVVFDVMSLIGADTLKNTYVERRALLEEVFQKRASLSVVLAPVMEPDPAVIEAMWAAGKEGVILKARHGLYRPGHRSKDIIKVKKENSVPTTIIGYLPGKSGPYSRIRVRDDNGRITSVKVKDAKMMAEIVKNPDLLIGERLRIKFQDFTPTDGYRHPRVDRWENR